MSSPATPAFLKAWRSHFRHPVLLAKLVFSAPSAKTVRLCTEVIASPDGSGPWNAKIIDADPVAAVSDILEPSVELVSTSIAISPGKLIEQGAGTEFSDLMRSYDIGTAKLTLYLWDPILSSWTDALPIFFEGRVSRVGLMPDRIVMYASQRNSWNKGVPPKTLNKEDYPRSSGEDNAAIAYVFGKCTAPPLLYPWNDASHGDKFRAFGINPGVIPSVVADNGSSSGAKIKVLAGNHSLGTSKRMFMDVGGAVCRMYDPTLYHLDTSTEGGMEIPALDFLYPVRPVDVNMNVGQTNCANPRNALDVDNATSYAVLTGGTNKLVLTMPNVGDPGRYSAIDVYVACMGSGTLNVQYNGANFNLTPGTGADVFVTALPGGNWPGNPWAFGGTSAAPSDLVLTCTAGSVRVYWAGFVARFVPSGTTVVAARDYTHSLQAIRSRVISLGGLVAAWRAASFFEPAIQSFDGPFWFHGTGYQNGTYSGAATLAKPADIARAILAVLAGETSFETGTETFGSFVTARGLCKRGRPFDYEIALSIAAKDEVRNILQGIALQSASLIYIDRFTGKWMMVPWNLGSPQDYDYTLGKDDLIEFNAEVTSDVGVANGVRVKYLYDYRVGKTLRESYIVPDGSSQGGEYPAFRDQRLVVPASCVLDWSIGGTGYTENLTAGATTPMALAQAIRSLMRARGGSAANMHVGHGFTIVAGYNDHIQFESNIASPVTYDAYIPAGTYLPYRLAEAVTYAIANAVDGSGNKLTTVDMVCTYQQGTYGTGTFNIEDFHPYQQGIIAHVALSDSAWPVLGFTKNNTVSVAFFGVPTSAECFWFASTHATSPATLNLNFQTNPDTNAGALLGYIRQQRTGLFFYYADFSRGGRETVSADSQAKYGLRPDLPIDATYIRDERVASILRDLIFDLRVLPRVQITFSTDVCPDLQRGRTIALNATVDAVRKYPGYGSNGSWAGRRFRVLEVRQNLFPSLQQEVVALEM